MRKFLTVTADCREYSVGGCDWPGSAKTVDILMDLVDGGLGGVAGSEGENRRLMRATQPSGPALEHV